MRLLCIMMGMVLLGLWGVSANAQDVLTLENCREMALENNKGLQMAEMESEEARLQKESAKKHFFPQLSSEAGFMRRNKQYQLFGEDMFLPVIPFEGIDSESGNFDPSILRDPDLAPEVIVINPVTGEPVLDAEGNPVFNNYAWLPREEGKLGQKNNYQLGLTLKQPVYMGGKIRAGYRMSAAGERIALARHRLTEAEVLQRTDHLFWQVVNLQESLELTIKWGEMLDQLVYDLEQLHEEGIVTQNQLLEARVKRNEIQLKEMQAENGLHLSMMALAQHLGLPFEHSFKLDDSYVPESSTNALPELVESAHRNRPEIHMLEEAGNVKVEEVRMARASMLPSVGLAAGYSYMNPNPYKGFQDEFGGDWQVGLSVKIPIYHFGEKRTRVARAQQKADRSRLELQEAREMVELEVSQSLYNLREARARLEMTESSLEQATENLRVNNDLLHQGRATTRDALEAQALWQQAHASHIEAKNQYRIAYTKLEKASGQIVK